MATRTTAAACAAVVLCLGPLAAGGPARAADADPDSPACRQAVDAMVISREAAASDLRRQEPLLQARRLVARLCLGQSDLAGPAPRTAQPPAALAPPIMAMPVIPPVANLTAPPLAPALPAPNPTFATTCDPAGCWDSHGSRITRAGTLLIGPRGACAQHGTLVWCP